MFHLFHLGHNKRLGILWPFPEVLNSSRQPLVSSHDALWRTNLAIYTPTVVDILIVQWSCVNCWNKREKYQSVSYPSLKAFITICIQALPHAGIKSYFWVLQPTRLDKFRSSIIINSDNLGRNFTFCNGHFLFWVLCWVKQIRNQNNVATTNILPIVWQIEGIFEQYVHLIIHWKNILSGKSARVIHNDKGADI